MFDDLEQNDQNKENQIPRAKTDISGNISDDSHLFNKEVKKDNKNIDDIFSDIDNLKKPAPLQPKIQDNQGDFNNDNLGISDSVNNIKKFFTLGAIFIVLALIIVGGFWLVNKFLPKSGIIINEEISEEGDVVQNEEGDNNNNIENNNVEISDEVEIIEDDINKDTDQDGLTDIEEKELGLNFEKVDSDEDGLFDREEVKIYRTDPLNKDSDGDGYTDGAEVKGGYNPKGDGKLFELP
jgi:hypothetical protein